MDRMHIVTREYFVLYVLKLLLSKSHNFEFKIFAFTNRTISFPFHLKGSIKSYLLLNWLQKTETTSVSVHPVWIVSWLRKWRCKKRIDRKTVNICKNIIIMANRCRSFIKCLHLKVPTLKPRYEWKFMKSQTKQ